MENNKSPRSRSSAQFHHSQWLQTTISDLDEKMKAMTTALEDCHSSDQGADMHHKRRKDVIQMLEEFSKSFRALAIAYDQLRSKTSHTLHSESSSSSNTSKTLCAICNKKATGNLEGQNNEEGFNCHLKSIMESPDIKFHSANLNLGQINKLEDEYHELTTAEPSSMKYKAELECKDTQAEERMTNFSSNENSLKEIEDFELSQRIEDPSMNHYKFDNMSSALEFQIIKLTEDNLRQLVELVRRNDEKRETIKKLQLELEALKRENKTLQISSKYSNADSECDQPRISRRGRISMSKLFRGCSL